MGGEVTARVPGPSKPIVGLTGTDDDASQRCVHDLDQRYCASCRDRSLSGASPASIELHRPPAVNAERTAPPVDRPRDAATPYRPSVPRAVR